MGALIRAHDWASTPVGPPETWPQSLRLTIRVILSSRQPMFIWWGEELTQFYNDAYSQTMGPAMHPQALGAAGRESWADIWPIIGPQVDLVMSGQGATLNVEQLVPINRHGTPEDVWWTYSYSPIDLDGQIGGVLVICHDVTEQHLRNENYRDQTRRMAQQFEQAPGFITVLRGPTHVFELANAAYRQLLGAGRDIIGRSVADAVPEAAGQGFIDLLDRVFETGEPFIGRRTPILLKTSEGEPPRQYYLDFIYQAIRDRDGTITGIFVEGQDVTDHVDAEQHLKLMNGELQHRVKNMLAIVQAIARQTLQSIEDNDAVKAFLSRLLALSRAHDLLVQQDKSTTPMATVVKSSIATFGMPDRFNVSGPDVELGSGATLSLSLIIHEMTTNAIKYGSLSAEEGTIVLDWSLMSAEEQDQLVIRWNERGGPPVPDLVGKTGFGTKLVRMGLDGTGGVTLNFAPEGLSAEIRAPLEKLRR